MVNGRVFRPSRCGQTRADMWPAPRGWPGGRRCLAAGERVRARRGTRSVDRCAVGCFWGFHSGSDRHGVLGANEAGLAQVDRNLHQPLPNRCDHRRVVTRHGIRLRATAAVAVGAAPPPEHALVLLIGSPVVVWGADVLIEVLAPATRRSQTRCLAWWRWGSRPGSRACENGRALTVVQPSKRPLLVVR